MTNITSPVDTGGTAPAEAPFTWRTPLDFSGIRFRDRPRTTGITIHCSATPPSRRWGAVEVDNMHRANNWLAIGYHFVITRDGVIEGGRPMNTRGAHCRKGDRNLTHVSVCLIGGVSSKPVKHIAGSPWNGSDAEANFTKSQMVALKRLNGFLMETYGLTEDDIEGHRDVPTETKACPSFNVQKWIKTGKVSLD